MRKKQHYLPVLVVFLLTVTTTLRSANQEQKNCKKKQALFRPRADRSDGEVIAALCEAALIGSTLPFSLGVLISTNHTPLSIKVPLFIAVKTNQTALFTALYKICRNYFNNRPIERDIYGRSLLEYAVKNRNLSIVCEIIKSWQTSRLMTDGLLDKNKNNIFHQIFMHETEKSPADQIFFSLFAEQVCDAFDKPTLFFRLYFKNKNGQTPIDIAFDSKLQSALRHLLVSMAENAGDKTHQFMLKNFSRAVENNLWELAALLVDTCPAIVREDTFYALASKNDKSSLYNFYLKLLLDGATQQILQSFNRQVSEKERKKLRMLAQLCHPGLTKDTLLFWGNIYKTAKLSAPFSAKLPVGHDLKITFKQ